MKKIIEYFQEQNIIFKSFQEIDIKKLNSCKKVSIYLGIDLKGYYVIVIFLSKKSKIFRKEVDDFRILHKRMEDYIDSSIKNNYIIIDAPLSSKAKVIFEEYNWKVFKY